MIAVITGTNRPGQFSNCFLVAPWKCGLSPEAVAKFDGKFVSLHGTLIYRDTQTMIEVDSTNIVEAPEPHPLPGRPPAHRACATLCIRGGKMGVNRGTRRAPQIILCKEMKSTATNHCN